MKTLYIVKDYYYYDSYCDSEIIFTDYKDAYNVLLHGGENNKYHLQKYEYNEQAKVYVCTEIMTLKDIIENSTIHNEV